MDKNRKVSPFGTLSVSGVSPRRKLKRGSRGSVKDASEEEERVNDFALLRSKQRPGNKEKERNKRKRSPSKQFQNDHGNNGGRDKEDYFEMSPICLPPPRPPLAGSSLKRKLSKLRAPWKGCDDRILAGLDDFRFPRRPRSGIKRPRDSASLSASASAASNENHRGEKSPSSPVAVPASPSSSNASVKQQPPCKRLKPVGVKPRSSKTAKNSFGITERELEVAEALYGLNRQFRSNSGSSSQQDNLSEGYGNNAASSIAKEEPSSAPLAISKVMSSSSVVSSSSALQQTSTLTSANATAPKRKKLRPAVPGDGATTMRPLLQHSEDASANLTISGTSAKDAEQGSSVTKAEFSLLKSENNNAATSCVNGTTTMMMPVSSAMSASNSNRVSSPLQTDASATSSKVIETKLPDPQEMPSDKALPSDLKLNALEVEDQNIGESNNKKLEGVEVEESKSLAPKEQPQPTELLPASQLETVVTQHPDEMVSTAPLSKKNRASDSSERILQSSEAPKSSGDKFDIDLMALPLEEESGLAATAQATEAETAEAVGAATIADLKTEHVKEEPIQEKREMANQGKLETEMKTSRQEALLGIDLEAEADEQKTSGDALPGKQSEELSLDNAQKNDLDGGAGGASNLSNAASVTVPTSSARLPSVGHIGSTVDNCQGAQHIPGASAEKGHRTSTVKQAPQKPWKRCATHCYIANFIACQQQLARHPFWTANFGNSLATYGGKPFNLNLQFPIPQELIHVSSTLRDSFSLCGPPTSNNNLQARAQNASNKSPLSLLSGQKKQNSAHQQQGLPTFPFLTSQIDATTTIPSKASNISNSSVAATGVSHFAHNGGTGGNLAAIPTEYLNILQSINPLSLNSQGHVGTSHNGVSNLGRPQTAPQLFGTPLYAVSQTTPLQLRAGSQPQPTTSVASCSSLSHKQDTSSASASTSDSRHVSASQSFTADSRIPFYAQATSSAYPNPSRNQPSSDSVPELSYIRRDSSLYADTMNPQTLNFSGAQFPFAGQSMLLAQKSSHPLVFPSQLQSINSSCLKKSSTIDQSNSNLMVASSPQFHQLNSLNKPIVAQQQKAGPPVSNEMSHSGNAGGAQFEQEVQHSPIPFSHAIAQQQYHFAHRQLLFPVGHLKQQQQQQQQFYRGNLYNQKHTSHGTSPAK
eukprot:TRINITY_DN16642_c0_g2_i1.p1 TRINITY_DN16642_c0_g2~~TRINITY_DN16642_c0_g2_i1.p1  ORF type:complete len:1158 (-),score=233.85 TRINITY_DN16642_c0_g2_i1:404-3877(-)